jgi:glucuronide carrier protein
MKVFMSQATAVPTQGSATPPGRGAVLLRPLRIIGYGAGDAGCNVAFSMTGLFLLIYYTDVVGIRPADAGSIFLFVKVWDAFADIFAGRLVDRTMTRWGKFRPFLLWYSVPLLLANIACFAVPDFSGYGQKLLYAYASYAILGLLYSLVNIPFGSLAGAMTQVPAERSKLAGARMVGAGTTIMLLAVLLAPRLKESANLQTTFVITAAVLAVVGTALFAFTFATARESVYREVSHVTLRQTFSTLRHNGPLLRLCGSSLMYLTGQNVVGAIALYFARDVLGDVGLGAIVTIITTGAILYVGPFGPLVTRRLGKKRGFMLAALAAIVGGLVVLVSPGNVPASLAGLFLIGLAMALMNTMTWALEADTVEFGEWKTGIRAEGGTYAAFSFTRKVGQAIGTGIVGYALAFVGYQQSTGGQTVTQSAQTIEGIRLTMALLPAGFFLFAFLLMWAYPLTEARFRALLVDIEANRATRRAELG